MAAVTVSQLAETTGLAVDVLLAKFKEAGLPQTRKDELVTDDQRQVLIGHIRGNAAAPSTITLKRKSTTTLKLSGGKSAVNVEVRQKRTYVKESAEESTRRAAEETEAQHKVEEQARLEAQERAKREAEAKAKREAEKEKPTAET